MKLLSGVFFAALLIAGCGPSTDVSKNAAEPTTKEGLYAKGHQLYLAGSPDEAIGPLKQAFALDSSYVAAVADLAAISYERTKRNEDSGTSDALMQARAYYARLEMLGGREADVYERLCELSVSAKDNRSFVRYAKKYADAFPYERQYYNLGLAYFAAGDFQNVIDSQKKAAEKFPRSQYLGAYFRQMGHAYIKIDRDQTAEKILEKGLGLVNARIAESKAGSAEARRLTDDKVGMLVSLKRIYTIYKESDKLRQVEKLLREAGQ